MADDRLLSLSPYEAGVLGDHLYLYLNCPDIYLTDKERNALGRVLTKVKVTNND